MTDRSSLRQAAKTIKNRYGEKVLGRSDVLASPDRRISTGSIDLDAALGGGARVGWITYFWGNKSGGKTTTALRTVGNAQGYCRNCYRPAVGVEAVPPSDEELEEDPDARWSAKGWCDCYAAGIFQPDPPPKETGEKAKEYEQRVTEWREALQENSYDEVVVAWVDLENSFDASWASAVGVDVKRLILNTPESAEESIDIICALIGTMDLDMLVIDSLAMLTPSKELEETMEKWQQGLQPRLLNKGIRKFTAGATRLHNHKRSCTQIWINQTREKIGIMFGDPTTRPGGKGQDFAVHSEIFFKSRKAKTVTEQWGNKDEKREVPVEETFNFKSTKSKAGSVFSTTGSYTQAMRDTDVYKRGTIVEDESIYKKAMYHLVEQDKKSKKYLLGDEEFKSQKEILERIREDPDFKKDVKEAILGMMLKGYRG